jgi:hypothetical protein
MAVPMEHCAHFSALPSHEDEPLPHSQGRQIGQLKLDLASFILLFQE